MFVYVCICMYVCMCVWSTLCRQGSVSMSSCCSSYVCAVWDRRAKCCLDRRALFRTPGPVLMQW